MTTTRISCSCDTCKTNAQIVGREFPLRADVNALMAGALASPKTGRISKTATHSLVELANHPTLSKASSVVAHGPWAVA